ncbi:MAG: hypothetical protein IKD80_06645 [Selenomonadaceae bacterium]|nr:hypothetical protein [Selenomonadaceae bacterium]
MTWLTQTFAGNEHTAKEAASLTEEVYLTIGKFSANMQNIEQACAASKIKEQWLKNFIDGNVNLSPEQKGEYLAQANAALNFGNQVMMSAMQVPQTIDITKEVNRLMQQDLPPVASPAQWNRYTMAPVVNELRQQSMLSGSTVDGVESFKNIGRVATGKISPIQAVEISG